MAMLFVVFFISAIILALVYMRIRIKENYKQWTRLNVPHLSPTIPLGNFQQSASREQIHFGIICRSLYEKLKQYGDCCGVYMFHRPAILVTGPEFAKTVLVRDFGNFVDRGVFQNPRDDPISANIFFNQGAEWKTMRQKLSPAFTSGKMKMMFLTLVQVADTLVDYIKKDEKRCMDVDIFDLMGRFTTDVVSSCIFGVEGQSISNANSEFRQIGKKLMKQSHFWNICNFLASLMPETACSLKYCMFDKRSNEFFFRMVRESIEYRKKNNIVRKDLMQIMMELLEKKENAEKLSLKDIAANAFVFFFAGFETTSTTLSVALHHLAFHKNIQNETRAEILTVLDKFDGNLTYESLSEMELLERVILETLRIFPPVATLHRITSSAYTLPNGSVVDAGTMLVLPVYGFHHDNDIFEEPEKFKPERFSEEEKAKRHPYSFLPFGEGPRICIGTRFAMMTIKVSLVRLLTHFEVSTCAKTEPSIQADPEAMTFTPKGQMWLTLKDIS